MKRTFLRLAQLHSNQVWLLGAIIWLRLAFPQERLPSEVLGPIVSAFFLLSYILILLVYRIWIIIQKLSNSGKICSSNSGKHFLFLARDCGNVFLRGRGRFVRWFGCVCVTLCQAQEEHTGNEEVDSQRRRPSGTKFKQESMELVRSYSTPLGQILCVPD